MRTLNRPMFRYGGPIKEGVMSGIREPKKNGGSMGPNEGPRRAALVGDPNFPQPDGRAHYVAPIVYGIGAGIARAAPLALRYGRAGINAVKGIFGKVKPYQGPTGVVTPGATTVVRGGARIPGATGSYSPISFSQGASKVTAGGPALGEGFVPSAFGTYLGGTATGKTLTGLYKGITSPTAVGLTQKAGKAIWTVAKDPITIVSAGYYFWPDGTPKTDAEIKDNKTPPPPGGLPGLLNKTGGQISKAEFAEKQKEERIANYRKIMNIEGMKKDAAYDSLIDASTAVTNSEDFKGDLKSGKLINSIINATSKQFDKPKQTEQSINALILKNQLEADTPSTKLKDLIAIGIDTPEKQEAYLRTQLGQPANLGSAKAAAQKAGAIGDQISVSAAEIMFPGEYKGTIIEKDIFQKQVAEATKAGAGRPNEIVVGIIANEAKKKGYPPGKYTVPGGIVVDVDKDFNVTIVR